MDQIMRGLVHAFQPFALQVPDSQPVLLETPYSVPRRPNIVIKATDKVLQSPSVRCKSRARRGAMVNAHLLPPRLEFLAGVCRQGV